MRLYRNCAAQTRAGSGLVSRTGPSDVPMGQRGSASMRVELGTCLLAGWRKSRRVWAPQWPGPRARAELRACRHAAGCGRVAGRDATRCPHAREPRGRAPQPLSPAALLPGCPLANCREGEMQEKCRPGHEKRHIDNWFEQFWSCVWFLQVALLSFNVQILNLPRFAGTVRLYLGK